MENSSTHCHHLSVAEREEIAVLREKGESFAATGRKLGGNRSSISREVGRNGTAIRNVKYRASQAQSRCDERKKKSHAKKRLANPDARRYVQSHIIHDGWTPQAISGRPPLDKPGLTANYESICLWIYRERQDLIPYLVRGHKKRHKRAYGKKIRSKIPSRTDISNRPGHINKRVRAGHWEADTVVSRQGKACAAVLAERKSRLFPAVKIKGKTARSFHKAIVKALSRFPRRLRKTTTYDNGPENALHETGSAVLGTKSYFCKPYHSWEKGSIENRNGIFRRYFPKKYNFELTNQKKIDKVIYQINSAPMKCLGFKTPLEVFARFNRVALLR